METERRKLLKRNHSFLISDILERRECSDAEQSSDEAGDENGEADVASSASSSAEAAGAALERGSAGGGHKCKKPRKARTAFTDQQLAELERSFERAKYLSVQVRIGAEPSNGLRECIARSFGAQDRLELAARLQLSDTQVKTWYAALSPPPPLSPRHPSPFPPPSRSRPAQRPTTNTQSNTHASTHDHFAMPLAQRTLSLRAGTRIAGALLTALLQHNNATPLLSKHLAI